MTHTRFLIRLTVATVVAGIVATTLSLTGAPITVASTFGIWGGGLVLMLPRWRRSAALVPAVIVAMAAATALDLSILPWTVAAIAAVGAAPQRPSAHWAQRVTGSATAAIGSVVAMAGASVLSDLTNDLFASVCLSVAGMVVITAGQWVSHLDAHHTRVSPWRVRRVLAPAHRAAVLHALDSAAQASRCTPDTDIRSGLDEVSTWVFTLQVHRQAIAQDLARFGTQADGPTSSAPPTDAFAAKQHAAACSLRARHQDHIRTLRVEAERTAALVDYALAWLDDAVASLTVAQRTAQVGAPIDMDRILARLRAHEREQDALRRTAVELA